MKDLIISKTFSTPEVKISPASGIINIEGRSISETSDTFYSRLIEHLEFYFQNPARLTELNIKLEYVNSRSSKYLLELLWIVNKYHSNGKNCMIKWYYEKDDESILELGEIYKSFLDTPFQIIDYQNIK